jgi:pilus assembly protein CpaF
MPESSIARTTAKIPSNSNIGGQPQPSANAETRIATSLEAIQALLTHQYETSGNSIEHYNSTDVGKLLAASPLAAFLADDGITDIFVNGFDEIWINRSEVLEKTNASFADAKSLRTLANAVASSVGRPLDPRRPLVDARLKDGSRVNIIAPPMAVDGLNLSIRKFPKQEILLETLIEKGEMSGEVAEFLKLCAQCRISLLVSGGTGTGKTTMLNAISRFIPDNERIITIEDTAELRMQQPHVVRLEVKEPQLFGERREEVNASDLVRNALRMKPHRIIIGEVRGDEAYDMIQALNTGHDGSMSTVHANTPRDAFTRIENLMSPRMPNAPAAHIRQQIVSVLSLIVQIVYNADGKRMVSSISEVVGMEGDVPTMHEIFTLKEHKDEKGAVHYVQKWNNILPRHPKLSQAMREHPVFAALMNNMVHAAQTAMS